MARRNMTSFAKAAPTSQGGSRLKHEEFCLYLKSLGYTLPRQTRPEQFDYLFNEDETSGCLETMMKYISAENVVSEEDLMRFRKCQGKYLQGEELETAVSDMNKVATELESKNQNQLLEQEELLRKIDEKKTTIAKLRQIESLVDVAISGKKEEDSMESYLRQNRTRESVNIETKVSTQIKLVNSLLASISCGIRTILQKYRSSAQPDEVGEKDFVSRIDLNEIFEEEDRIVELCQSFIEQCETELILEEDKNDEAHPLVVEEIRQIFQEYSKDIERLKHVIIYESVKKIELTFEESAFQNLTPKIKNLTNFMHRYSSIEPKSKRTISTQKAGSNVELQTKLKNLKHYKLHKVRQSLAHHFNQEIQSLTELKLHSKINVHNLFSFVLDVLANQRARILAVEQLLKSEALETEKFAKELKKTVINLRNFTNEQVAQCSFADSQRKRAPNEEKLIDHLNKFGIPMAVLFSYQSTWQNLAWIRSQLTNAKKTLETSNAYEVSQNIAGLIENSIAMSKIWEDYHLEKDDQQALIRDLEKVHEDRSSQLSWYAENKDRITKDSIQKKVTVIQEMKSHLSRAVKDKETRDRARREAELNTSSVF